MTEKLTVELPAEKAQRLRDLAAKSQRPVEELLLECIDRVTDEPPVDCLADDQVLAICGAELPGVQQAELSELFGRNREGELTPLEQRRLDQLMQGYRQGLVRKAQAMRVAVARGLLPRLK
jgi:hypothetical protein